MQRLAIAAGLFLVTVAAYSDITTLDFVTFDDYGYVVDNPYVRNGFSTEGVVWAFTSQHLGYWAPLLWLSHMLDAQLFGLDPAGHHFVNLLLHLANALLLFALLERMSGRVWPSAFAATIFAVHPLNIESVAWVAERKNVLSTLFWLIAMAAYFDYTKSGRLRSYLLTAMAMIAGLMVKATLVTLPLALLLVDFWPLGRIRGEEPLRTDAKGGRWLPVDFPWQRAGRLAVEKVPLLAISALASIVTFLAQEEVGAVVDIAEGVPLDVRLSNAVVSYVLYLRNFLWPANLAAFYPFVAIVGLEMWSALDVALASFVLAALSITALATARRHPYVFVGWFWFLGVMVPMIGLVQVGAQSMADRHAYVPMIGLLVAGAWTVSDLAGAIRYRRSLLAAGFALVTLSCVMVSRGLIPHWQNSLSLFERAIAVTEHNWIALNNAAWLLAVCPDPSVRDGQKAVLYAEQASELTDHADPSMLDTLAAAYAEASRFGDAIRIYSRAIRIPEVAEDPREVRAVLERVKQLRGARPFRSSRGCPEPPARP